MTTTARLPDGRPTATDPVAIRGDLLHCVDDPGIDGRDPGVESLRDAVVVTRGGRIEAVGPAASLLPTLGPGVRVDDWRGHLIVPGFVDVHVHYPQVDVIASYGTQLLDWLERHTFPQEARFADPGHAAAAATFFFDELLRNGTTTAAIFCTVHPGSVDACLGEAERRGLRMVAGKCVMDRHCPPALRDTADSGYRDSKALIERWHGRDRLGYAITPRFAITSSEQQLDACARLAREHPDVWVQTHVAENRAEVEWVAQLFPQRRSYLDVYDHHGLLRERTLLAHAIWLDEHDRERLAASGAAAVFCPSSNLFLGSGCFDLRATQRCPHCVALGTDVGGGTSYSMLRTLGDAYKVQQLLGVSLSPAQALYLATLAGARAMRLDDRIGSIRSGFEADLVVLDPRATPLLARRNALRDDPLDHFFALMTLGDDRAVRCTYVGARPWTA